MDIRNHFKGIQFFWKGLKAAKNDMWASIQVLLIITLVLCTILYFVEHAAQPDVYAHWYDPYVWGFMGYLGNPGDFSPGEPISLVGRWISIAIAVIKILIFAVPAGLVAHGFSEAMAKDKEEKKNVENVQKIYHSMHCHCSLLSNVRFWPKKWYRFTEIMTNLDINENEIVSAIRSTPKLRMRDLSTWLTTTGGIKPEMLAVEICYGNIDESYGYHSINNKSNVTIVVPSGNGEAGLAYFAYHIGRIGRFNVVINEILGSNADSEENRCIVEGIYDYQYNDDKHYKKLQRFVNDIKECVKSKENWVIILKAKATPNEASEKLQKIRLSISVADEEKENSLSDCVTVNDHERLQDFYDDMCETLKDKHNIEPIIRFSIGKKTLLRNYVYNRFDSHPNVIEIDLSDDYRLFGTDVKASYTSIYTLACLIHSHFDKDNTECNCLDWNVEDIKKNRVEEIPNHIGEKKS